MKDIRSDLKAYLDKELPSERMEEIRLALEADAELREEAEFYQLLSRSIIAAAKTPEVTGMDQTVSKTLKTSERKRLFFHVPSAPGWVWKAAGGVAAIGLLAVIVFPIFAQAKNAAKKSNLSAKLAYERESASSPAAPMEESKSAYAEKMPADAAPARSRAPGIEELAEMADKAASKPEARAATPPPVLQSNRLINRSADMTIRVKEVGKAAAEAERIAQRFGGFVESSSVSSDPKNPTASLNLRVASKNWVAATQAFRDLGIVLTESSSGEDVTAQVVDLEARVKTLRAEEESLRVILSRAYRLGDILQVKDRISQVRMEIESMTGQAKQLRNLAALSSVSLNLVQEPKVDDETKPDPWMEDSWTSAVNSLQSVLKVIGSFLTYVLVFAPLWLPTALIAWVVVRKVNKSG